MLALCTLIYKYFHIIRQQTAILCHLFWKISAELRQNCILCTLQTILWTKSAPNLSGNFIFLSKIRMVRDIVHIFCLFLFTKLPYIILLLFRHVSIEFGITSSIKSDLLKVALGSGWRSRSTCCRACGSDGWWQSGRQRVMFEQWNAWNK